MQLPEALRLLFGFWTFDKHHYHCRLCPVVAYVILHIIL